MLGQVVDENKKLITGCPLHKEMIGSEGDKCPKCDYITMITLKPVLGRYLIDQEANDLEKTGLPKSDG